MVFGIGVDILEIEHFKKNFNSLKTRKSLDWLFTKEEINYAEKNREVENLATTFAGKEAVLKALNLDLSKKNYFPEIKIKRDSLGKPYVFLKGNLAKKFPKSKFQIFISLSFESKIVIAFAILEKV